ncbi:MAG: nucleoside 2-deoxyribosyltransferase [Planctomycetes bacterium]|nr:nucleoside 2-deoxyribosyltransferase [Planctomycetota bacterium]
MLYVYLAGPVRGRDGAWRERIPDLANVCFMHPGAQLPGADVERRSDIYGPADRLAVRKCDLLLANCDRSVGGHGTALEIGMALALGKEIVLVCPTEDIRHTWRLACACVPIVYDSLESALEVVRYAAAQVSGTARCAADQV